mmetsp:Transcript_3646/g.6028  ORF Transcript_3646/g.6028 Transcript_3646/m.6028 type:complete len:143 (+) Transcript_3646:154-582(+)
MIKASSLVFFLAIIIFSSDSSAFVNRRNLIITVSAMSSGPEPKPTTMLESKEEKEVLQLPEASNDPSIPSIKLGDSIKFEDMGPVIINADGSTRQIANWDKMTEAEQQVAWRRISKRNEERRKVLLEQQQQQQEQMNEGKNE